MAVAVRCMRSNRILFSSSSAVMSNAAGRNGGDGGASGSPPVAEGWVGGPGSVVGLVTGSVVSAARYEIT